MNDLIKRIKSHEGNRRKPYLDTQGLITIGWGRCLSTTGITDDEAEYLFLHDIERAVANLDHLPQEAVRNCNQVRRSVLVEMLFQLGLDGVLKFKRMLQALEDGDFKRAADEIVDSELYEQCKDRTDSYYWLMRDG